MGNKKGKSFVTIMIITAVTALILRVAIKQIIKMNIAQNESDASATIRLISAALENYAKENRGIYPVKLSVLTQNKPPYLDKDYIGSSPIKGYDYDCTRLESSGYSCSAVPVKCRLTGKIIYTVITGGSLMSEECVKKE
jgi:type II secretory pathway pseudopilin PulG